MSEGPDTKLKSTSEQCAVASDSEPVSFLDGKTPEEKAELKKLWRQRVRGYEWADYLRRKELRNLTIEQSMKDYAYVLKVSSSFSRRAINELRSPDPSESLVNARMVFDLAGRDRKHG